PITGAEHLITTDEVLSETQQPNEIVFVGGGVVALEFSHVYVRAGTKVTILEVMPQLLPRMDTDAVAQVASECERLGITIHTGVSVEAITQTDAGLSVTFSKDGEEQTVKADRVVNGAGRMANVTDLDLAAADIEYDGIRIKVSDCLQSISNPAIWVAGDALVGAPQLSPIATYEGQIVGRNILNGATESPTYFALPSAVYTVPSFATVGMTEAEARDKHPALKVTVNDMSGWFSGKSYAETIAWAKVLIDEDGDQIVGAHIVGHNADDLIHVFAFSMTHNIKVSAIKNTIFAYPSFSSDIKNLL
ncbi:MAG: NAD(P)/FAD-dependent oxidoreductase, partial [Kordiimonadaceae bacterium]|nr:NAD(P)/FAD-dependent oxidoreductase [Kordiimonadaceae bacterium]